MCLCMIQFKLEKMKLLAKDTRHLLVVAG
uniref:Uncharacterized protein n=1 Tax=Arundo donax TaxID=35708 RepID=A0A0A9HR57_ARUDO